MARRLDPSYPLNPEQAYQTLINIDAPVRIYLNRVRQQLTDWFLLGADTELLLNLHAKIIDNLLSNLWQQQNCGDEIPIALLAVGGYGRGQLHLHSDIDITFIIADKITEQEHYLQKIQNFITHLWDSHLIIGHSVRSLTDTWQQAKADQTILTNLLESRWLCGNKALAERMQSQLYTLCPADIFIQKKFAEYQTRHARYAMPPYTLEPNIKCSPGGQRDMQLIEWLLSSRTCCEIRSECLDHDQTPQQVQGDKAQLNQVFQDNELEEWQKIKKYLNTLRFALHLQNTKANDQLVFDHQLQLAQVFSEEGKNNNQAVSNFMRRYFNRTRRSIQLVNRALQQLGAFNTLPEKSVELDYPIDLQSIKAEPWLIFELFAVFSEQKISTLLSVATQRLLIQGILFIAPDCYQDAHYQKPFLRILRSGNVTATLTLMHEYQILGKYIPLFAHVTGMMQYDLFHAYPVDQHTLMLVQQLENLVKGTNTSTFPLGVQIAKPLEKPELLYLAGFFHDIGKGQQGHHEEIGAEAVKIFCLQHHYSTEDSELVTWLVLNHLLLSQVAQQQDISNPAVIEAFAKKVKDTRTLIYLYLLTIADIYATNTKLWTGWRISLIDGLYQETYLLLDQPQQQQIAGDRVEKKQQAALKILNSSLHKPAIELWKNFNADYFLTYPAPQLAMQAEMLLNATMLPLVKIQAHHSHNATEVFIYAPQRSELFFTVTSLLDSLQLSIVAAHIHTTHSQHNLSTYIVLQRGNKPLDDPKHIERVQQKITSQLRSLDRIASPTLQALSTRLQTFNYPTIIEFDHDHYTNNTILRLFTADRPGLLANVARVFHQQGIQVLRAQINTLAERAEDIFWLLNAKHQPLLPTEKQLLQEQLYTVLGS